MKIRYVFSIHDEVQELVGKENNYRNVLFVVKTNEQNIILVN